MNNESLLYLCKKILSVREEKILYLYFGINCSPANFEEIADEFQVTHERIKQIFNKAISKIRNANFEVFSLILEKARKGSLIEENAHNFDRELDDLTMAKICHKVYGKQCTVAHNKYLKHIWINNCDLKKVIFDTLELLKKSPIDLNTDQILSYCSGDSESLDFGRRILEDLVYFDNDKNTLSSLMPLEDRLSYLLKKNDGVVTIWEIMNNFGINRDKACRLMEKGRCWRIGKTLCYDYNNENILVRLLTDAYEYNYAKEPLDMEENHIYTLGIKFGLNKQDAIDAINSLVDSRPDIFTRVDGKIALSEWYIKRKSSPRKKYATKLLDAIMKVIEGLDAPVTSIEIHDLMSQKYGQSASSNLTSIRLSLKNLYEAGKIGRIGTKNEYRYFLPKN